MPIILMRLSVAIIPLLALIGGIILLVSHRGLDSRPHLRSCRANRRNVVRGHLLK